MVYGILLSLSNSYCVNLGDLWEADAKTALNRESFYGWCTMSALKKTGREPEKATTQIRPVANLISREGAERKDREERSLGGNFIVNGRFSKAVAESLSQSWLTKESFVFPGWSALLLTLPLRTCEAHVLSSNTEVRVKSGSLRPHIPFVRHVLTAATTTKPASPNLASFLISAPELWPASGKLSRNDLLAPKFSDSGPSKMNISVVLICITILPSTKGNLYFSPLPSRSQNLMNPVDPISTSVFPSVPAAASQCCCSSCDLIIFGIRDLRCWPPCEYLPPPSSSSGPTSSAAARFTLKGSLASTISALK